MACQTWNDMWMMCCSQCFDWDLDFDWASASLHRNEWNCWSRLRGTERDRSIRRMFERCWKTNIQQQRKRYNNSLISYYTTGYSFLLCHNYRKISRSLQKEGRNKKKEAEWRTLEGVRVLGEGEGSCVCNTCIWRENALRDPGWFVCTQRRGLSCSGTTRWNGATNCLCFIEIDSNSTQLVDCRTWGI